MEPNFEQYAQMMQKMMADSLAAADQARDAALAELATAQEERRLLEEKADQVVAERLSKERSAIAESVRQQLWRDIAGRMLQDGMEVEQIAAWLEVEPAFVERLRAKADPVPANPSGARLEYQEMGRGGVIYYHEKEAKLTFHYEFGAGDALVLIFVPTKQEWEAATGLELGRRDEILHYLGQQVVRDKAAGHEYRIGGNILEIVKP